MPQPGWYPDPKRAGFERWWNGVEWTETSRPAAPPMPMSPPISAASSVPAMSGATAAVRVATADSTNPGQDLAEESKYGRWAVVAIWCGLAAYLVDFAITPFRYAGYGEWFQEVFREASKGSRNYQPPQPPQSSVALDLLGTLASFALLTVGVVFIAWFFKAAQVGQRSGLQSSFGPMWAIFGFIPILNLFIPYLVARNMLPPGHPARSTVKQWWFWWLGMGFAYGFAIVISMFSMIGGAVFALIAAVFAVMAALKVISVISEINRAHADLIHTRVQPF